MQPVADLRVLFLQRYLLDGTTGHVPRVYSYPKLLYLSGCPECVAPVRPPPAPSPRTRGFLMEEGNEVVARVAKEVHLQQLQEQVASLAQLLEKGHAQLQARIREQDAIIETLRSTCGSSPNGASKTVPMSSQGDEKSSSSPKSLSKQSSWKNVQKKETTSVSVLHALKEGQASVTMKALASATADAATTAQECAEEVGTAVSDGVYAAGLATSEVLASIAPSAATDAVVDVGSAVSGGVLAAGNIGLILGKDLGKGLGSLAKAQNPLRVHDGEIPETVGLEGSMWDVAMLIGAPQWNVLTSAWVSFLLFLNILMQGLYIYILFSSNLTSPQYTEHIVVTLRDWRKTVAHDVTNYDQLQDVSLANRVCDTTASKGLHLSSKQADIYGNLNEYLGDRPGKNFPRGMVMCVISLTAWYLTCCKEIVSATALLRAIWVMPVAEHSEITKHADGKFEIHKLSKLRSFGTICACLVRLTVCYVMLCCGTFFLACEAPATAIRAPSRL